jgi:hypothetical protein
MGLAASDELATRAEVRLLELEMTSSTSAVQERQRAQKLNLEAKAGAAAKARESRRCAACFITFSSVLDLAAHECFAGASEPSVQDGVTAGAAEPGRDVAGARPEAGRSCQDIPHGAGPQELSKDPPALSQGPALRPPARDGESIDIGPGTSGVSAPHVDSTNSLGLLGAYDSESDEDEALGEDRPVGLAHDL